MGNLHGNCVTFCNSLCDNNSNKSYSNMGKNNDHLSPKKETRIFRSDANLIDMRHSGQYIDSSHSYNDFVRKVRGTIKIQREYRLFLYKKNKKKTSNKQQPLSNVKDGISKKSTFTFQNDNIEPQVFNEDDDDSIDNIEIMNGTNPINKGEDYTKANSIMNQASESHIYSFYALTKKSSIHSSWNCHTSFRTNTCSNTKIKGYFLKKNKKYQYKGSLLGKSKHGFGIVKWEDDSIFHAKFADNNARGYCKYTDCSSSIFKGYYLNTRPKGYGIYEDEKVIIEGKWRNDNTKGICIESWKDDYSFYQGETMNSMKEGIGLYRWGDGTIYQGEWKNNKMTGYGVIFYPNDRVYAGEINEGMIHGQGQFSWPDKKRYIGGYINQKKEGFGIFIWTQSPLIAHVGFYEKGQQNGVGILITNGKSSIGIWKNGKKEYIIKDSWEIKQYLKGSQLKYNKFLSKSSVEIIHFILKISLD